MNRRLHAEHETYGAGAYKWKPFVDQFTGRTVLDYGCGKGSLAMACDVPINEYDPAVPGKDSLPKPHEVVVCIDVLEHIEPEFLDAVLEHMHSLMKWAGLFVVATRPANKTLPDGRNAHLIIKDLPWWEWKLSERVKIRYREEDTFQPGEAMYFVKPKRKG